MKVIIFLIQPFALYYESIMLSLSKQGLRVQPCCSYAIYSTLQTTNTAFQKLHLTGKNKSLFSILPVITGSSQVNGWLETECLPWFCIISLRICCCLLFEIRHWVGGTTVMDHTHMYSEKY